MNHREKSAFAIIAVLMTMMLVLMSAGCGGKKTGASSGASDAKGGAPLTVTMLDVGQGDAILVRTPSQTMLIDTSDKDENDKFKKALDREGVKTIDKLILTHPHADHIGGVQVLMKGGYDVKAVYDNGQTTTTKMYRDYLKAIKSKNIPYKTLRAGDVLDFGDGVKFTVLSPTEDMVKEGGHEKGKDGKEKINLNLNSIVGRLTYKDFAMLFTGDAEKPTEQGIIQRYGADALKSQVLKSPHHGSNTASSQKFLKAVAPDIAVISCGVGNDYHHPHPSIRTRYKQDKIDFYRTDVNGRIVITSDGNGYNVSAERGDKNSDKGN